MDAAYLISFKAKAWMDLTDRKATGEHVDSKNIKKHKNDVFRLTELIDPTAKVVVPQGVYADIQEFVQRMKNKEELPCGSSFFVLIAINNNDYYY